MRLVLPGAEAAPSPFADSIAKAKQTIPRPVEWKSLAADLTATSEKSWRLCLAPQSGPKRDLFVEPPEAWWFDVKPDANGSGGTDCFRVSLMQKPPDAALPVAAKLTITGGAGPVETTIALRPGAKLCAAAASSLRPLAIGFSRARSRAKIRAILPSTGALWRPNAIAATAAAV